MTAEHIKVVLESVRDCSSLWRMCQEFARGHMPPEILQAVRIGRMTLAILSVVWSHAHLPMGPAVEQHTSPFQFALPPDPDVSVSPTSRKR